MKLVAGTTLWKTACHDQKNKKNRYWAFAAFEESHSCTALKTSVLMVVVQHHHLLFTIEIHWRCVFFLRVPLLWRYLDRLRGIAGGSLPSAGVQGGRSQRWKLVGKKNDHKVTKDKIKVGSQSQGFFLNCGQPKPPSWGRIFEVSFFWGKKRWSFRNFHIWPRKTSILFDS